MGHYWGYYIKPYIYAYNLSFAHKCLIATNVNFRMDSDLKKSTEALCDELGMSMTTAFTIFAKKND